MAAANLNILIAIKQVGQAALTGLESGLKRVNVAARAYSDTLRSSSAAAGSMANSLGRLAAVLGSADLYRRAITAAFQYNNTVEQSQIGIAALVRSFNDFTDAQGRLVTGQKAYQLSMDIATQIQKKLQIEGLKTTATYEELLRVMQEGLGPAFKAGFKPDEIVKFVSMMAQAAAALSLPMNQLGQEVRAILDGTIDRNARIAKALGVTNEMMKQVIANGTGFQFLSEKLKEFEISGSDAARTFSGAWSNLIDAIQMALGTGLTGAFETTRKLILDLTRAIVTIDETAGIFTFNEAITAALKRVDEAIVKVLGNGADLNQWVATAAKVFSDVAVAVLTGADAFIKLVNAIGPFLPAIVQTVFYLGMAKLAFGLLIGIPLSIAAQIRALYAAIVALTGGQLLAWLASLRAALIAAAASTTALGLAFKGVLALAAAQSVIEIANLVKAVYQYINATRELKTAQAEAKEASDYISPRTAQKLAEISKATGINIASMKEFNKLVQEGKLIWSEATKQWSAPAKTDATATMTPKKTPMAVDEASINEMKRLEEQLANDLIRLSGDKWEVMRNQAKKHYEDQLKMAHGNGALIAKVKEVYAKEMERIAEEQADAEGKIAERAAQKAIQEQEKIDIATAKSQAARTRAVTETAVAQLDAIYQRGDVSIETYFARRRALLEDEYTKEIAALEAQKRAELDVADQIRIQDDIFERQEKHKRDIIDLTEKQATAEAKLADQQREIERILGNIQSRTMQRMGTADLQEQFRSELALLDQQHTDELQRLKELNASKTQIDDAYRSQKLEKDRLLADQDRRIWENMLDSAKVVAGSMSQAFTDLYELSGKKNKEFFYLAKTAAIAEAIINTAQAVTKALAQGGMWGTAQAAALAALGGVQIAKIQAQTLARGGPVRGWSPTRWADNIPIMATAGEFMQPVDAVSYYGRDVMEAIRRKLIPRDLLARWGFSIPSPAGFALAAGGSVPAMAGQSSFSVSVPVTISGVTNAASLGRVLPQEIERTVIRVMRDQLR